MIDLMWYMGLPMFAVGVLGSPYQRLSGNDSGYNLDQFDTIYDQKQSGVENYKVNVDGVSLIWTSSSLLAAAALLDPALLGDIPDGNIDIVFGEEKPEDLELPFEKPTANITVDKEQPSSTNTTEQASPTLISLPEVSIVEQVEAKPIASQKKSSTHTRRKVHWPQLLRSVLRNRNQEKKH
ncbi:hypothetical protein GWI33_010269 [Rhynchophorus ferrugineus]|uniref:Uncharacterized protein n=1 Tax=Rhynchophorus ferrugineus TaxID=354439 RepID=A0A834IC05_RHYFE|nr:hypothetical protein GWI33_010269 [Rhynchophorus ferrugineus]